MRKTEGLNGLGGGPSCPSLGQDNTALSGPCSSEKQGCQRKQHPNIRDRVLPACNQYKVYRRSLCIILCPYKMPCLDSFP